MKITFLGTGTSVGVPMIGCDCDVCTSSDRRNRRRRAALLVESDGYHLLIDTPPDLREQALEYRIARVDSVLITHAHADHVFGMDDLRRFNTIQHAAIPVYGSVPTVRDLCRIFEYVLRPPEPGVYRPDITFQDVAEDQTLTLGPFQVTPFAVRHGRMPTLGYRIHDADGRSLAYAPDCSALDNAMIANLGDLDVMILDALRDRPHGSHLTLNNSVALLRRIDARRAFVTHLCHDLDHATVAARLPAGIDVPWDGLTLTLS